MIRPTTPSSLLRIILLQVALCSTLTTASHQLTYNHIVSQQLLLLQGKEDMTFFQFAESLTKDVATSLYRHVNTDHKKNDDEKQFDTQCFPRKQYSDDDNDVVNVGAKCIVDYLSSGFSFDILTIVSKSIIYGIEEEEGNTHLGIEVQIMMHSASIETKDALIDTVSFLHERLNDNSKKDTALLSSWQLRDRNQAAKPQTSESFANMDTRILSNDGVTAKRPIYSSQNTQESSRIDIWEYITKNTNVANREIFIDSKLRGTTSAISTAHAEAFVHPALISHALPKRVAVISDMPVEYVREILKYKSVREITLIGATQNVIDAAILHMPNMNDCSQIENVDDNCMKDSRVEIVHQRVSVWAEELVDQCKGVDYDAPCTQKDHSYVSCAPYPSYDVVLVDLSSDDKVKAWLNNDWFHKIVGITTTDSVVVFNTGFPPNADGIRDTNEIDNFVRDMESYAYENDLWTSITVYDEPVAAPQKSAFLMIHSWYSSSYLRFVRESPEAIDMDIMRRMQSKSLPPTRFYDGTAHIRYLRPSRVWENWYCHSDVGKDTLDCSLLVRDWYNATKHDHKTEVRRDKVTGRSLHAAQDIPKGSFIQGDDTHMHLHIDSHQWKALNNFVKNFPDAKLYKDLRDFFMIYGFQNEPMGLSGWSVSVASNNTFTNHACSMRDENVKAFPYTNDEETLARTDKVFSFVQWRRPKLYMATGALRDIKQGEPILMDYSAFRTFNDPKYTALIKSFCDKGIGLVEAEDGSGANQCVLNGTCTL